MTARLLHLILQTQRFETHLRKLWAQPWKLLVKNRLWLSWQTWIILRWQRWVSLCVLSGGSWEIIQHWSKIYYTLKLCEICIGNTFNSSWLFLMLVYFVLSFSLSLSVSVSLPWERTWTSCVHYGFMFYVYTHICTCAQYVVYMCSPCNR